MVVRCSYHSYCDYYYSYHYYYSYNYYYYYCFCSHWIGIAMHMFDLLFRHYNGHDC
jgi:hypothetical protein